MNYQKIYNSIIDHRKNSPIFNGYFEKHHIIPKSCGGQDDKNNLISLTAKEHFICHHLLIKIYPIGTPEYNNMLYAYRAMVYLKSKGQHRITARIYEINRKAFSKIIRKFFQNSIWVHNPITGKRNRIQKGSDIPEGYYLGWKNQYDSSYLPKLIHPIKPLSEEAKAKRKVKLQKNWENVHEKMAEGRRKSKLWNEYSQNPEYKERKRISSLQAVKNGKINNPDAIKKIRNSKYHLDKAKKISINGEVFNSLNSATKTSPYCMATLKKYALDDIHKNIFFC
jgi:hypothetical protein